VRIGRSARMANVDIDQGYAVPFSLESISELID
jgi:hypothetical protein